MSIVPQNEQRPTMIVCTGELRTYITNALYVLLVQFTHAVRLITSWYVAGRTWSTCGAARYFVGLTPQVNMAKVQITVYVNPGFHAILLGIFKNANYFT